MRRTFWIDAVALGLSDMGTEARLAFWKELEADYARAWQEANPDKPASAFEPEWLEIAHEIGQRLSALENRSRPILRLRV